MNSTEMFEYFRTTFNLDILEVNFDDSFLLNVFAAWIMALEKSLICNVRNKEIFLPK